MHAAKAALQFNFSSVVVKLCEAIDAGVRGCAVKTSQGVGGCVITEGVDRSSSAGGSDVHKHRRHFVPIVADYSRLRWLRSRLR